MEIILYNIKQINNFQLKVLIIRLSSIGDIILTSPAIKYAKQYKHAEVHYLTKKANEELVKYNSNIDKVFLYDKNLSETIKELKEESYDIIFDLHNNLRTFIIKHKLKAKTSTLNKYNFSKWLMVKFKRKIEVPHIVVRYLKTIDRNFDNEFNDELEFWYQRDIDIQKKHVLPDDYYCFSLGAKHFTKKIPVSLVIGIIEKIDLRVVLIGGSDVINESNKIENACKHKVTNLCGKLTISESADVIQHSKLLVTSDTGMMHLASALQKETHVLWGNTVPEFGMYAYYGKNKSKTTNYAIELNCRPCSKIGFDKCPKGHFRCMFDQDQNYIVSMISASLG